MAPDRDVLFSAPAWLRNLGFSSWLLVRFVLVIVGLIWLLGETSTIVMPVILATVVGAAADLPAPAASPWSRRNPGRGREDGATFHPARMMRRRSSGDGIRGMRCHQTSRRMLARHKRMRRTGLLVAGLILIPATVAGCGESDADKAQTQVCDAVADLKVQIDELSALTPATATADGVKSNLNAIDDDLNQIKDAQGDLSDDRKQQVESATKDFASEVKAVAASLGSDPSLAGAKSKLEASGRQLANSYEQAFGQVDCGS